MSKWVKSSYAQPWGPIHDKLCGCHDCSPPLVGATANARYQLKVLLLAAAALGVVSAALLTK